MNEMQQSPEAIEAAIQKNQQLIEVLKKFHQKQLIHDHFKMSIQPLL